MAIHLTNTLETLDNLERECFKDDIPDKLKAGDMVSFKILIREQTAIIVSQIRKGYFKILIQNTGKYSTAFADELTLIEAS